MMGFVSNYFTLINGPCAPECFIVVNDLVFSHNVLIWGLINVEELLIVTVLHLLLKPVSVLQLTFD